MFSWSPPSAGRTPSGTPLQISAQVRSDRQVHTQAYTHYTLTKTKTQKQRHTHTQIHTDKDKRTHRHTYILRSLDLVCNVGSKYQHRALTLWHHLTNIEGNSGGCFLLCPFSPRSCSTPPWPGRTSCWQELFITIPVFVILNSLFILIFFFTPSLRQLTEWSLDPLDEALDLIVDALKPPELRQNVWERN